MDFLFRLIPPARWRLILMAVLVFTIVLCFLSYSSDSQEMQNAAIILLATAVGGNFAFWRCPRCRRTLPWKDMMHLERCPHCKADVKNYNGK